MGMMEQHDTRWMSGKELRRKEDDLQGGFGVKEGEADVATNAFLVDH